MGQRTRCGAHFSTMPAAALNFAGPAFSACVGSLAPQICRKVKAAYIKLYSLFLLMAAATVFSPGPGVVMTLTNALRFGYRGTPGGIIGIAFGTLMVAAVSATSLGVLMAASAFAFTFLKMAGAANLIYLGIRLWRAPAPRFDGMVTKQAGFGRRFAEGLSLTLTNPKAIIFLLSVFPQFIDPSGNYFRQFSVLVLTFSSLIIVIHGLYAFFARFAKGWLASERGGRVMNRIGGVTFVFFGAALVTAKRYHKAFRLRQLGRRAPGRRSQPVPRHELHGMDALGEPLGEKSEYNRIVIVAHSLGSVIAYDLVRYCWAEAAPVVAVSCSLSLTAPAGTVTFWPSTMLVIVACGWR